MRCWRYSYLALLRYGRPILQRCLSVLLAVCSSSLGSSLVGPARSAAYLYLCRLLHWHLPTQDILQSYGSFITNRRPICENSSECIAHLFLSYPFTSKAWRVVCGLFAVSFQTFDTVMDMWLFVSCWSFCPQIFQLWVAAVLYTWDFIWHSRNLQVFQEKQFTFHHYLTSLIGWLCMVSIIAKSHIGYATSDLSILRGLGVQGRPRLAVPLYLS